MKLSIFVCALTFSSFFKSCVGVMDEAKCAALNKGSDVRTKPIWDSCLVTSWFPTTWPIANMACKQFRNGHLVNLNNDTKVAQFKNIINEWSAGAGTAGKYWVKGAAIRHYKQPFFDSNRGLNEGSEVLPIQKKQFVCQYRIEGDKAEERCKEADSSTGTLFGKTFFKWGMCLVTSEYPASWSEAKEACLLLNCGRLVRLDSNKKIEEFREILQDWGVDKKSSASFWVSQTVTRYNHPYADEAGVMEGTDSIGPLKFVCQYPIISKKQDPVVDPPNNGKGPAVKPDNQEQNTINRKQRPEDQKQILVEEEHNPDDPKEIQAEEEQDPDDPKEIPKEEEQYPDDPKEIPEGEELYPDDPKEIQAEEEQNPDNPKEIQAEEEQDPDDPKEIPEEEEHYPDDPKEIAEEEEQYPDDPKEIPEEEKLYPDDPKEIPEEEEQDPDGDPEINTADEKQNPDHSKVNPEGPEQISGDPKQIQVLENFRI